MAEIPATFQDLFDRPVIVSLATILPDGSPQVTPVWCDTADGLIRVNTAKGRQKHHDMVARPHVTVMALDPENGGRYIEVRGTVTTISEEGADAHIDKLAKDYIGVDEYPYRNPAETRIICYIQPTKVYTQG